MWSEALSMLERADRLHRQFFTHDAQSWEPPIDVVESGDEVRLQVALPGVPADSISVSADASGVIVSALRSFPCRDADAHIHRVEIPYGRFRRHIGLSFDDFEFEEKKLQDGILTLTFRRK